MKRISPTGDLGFKKVLGSEENKDILAGLIKDFFDVTAEEITIESPYSIALCKRVAQGKEETLLSETIKDVAASFRTADFVSEVQIKKTLFFDERSLYYPLDRFCKNYDKAGHMTADAKGRPIRFSSLRPVYALNILGYNHFQDEDALRIFELYDPVRQKSFKQLLRLGYFELKKRGIETSNQGHWHDYFNTGEVNPEAPEYIRRASGIIEYINLSEEERDVARTLEKARAIYDTELVSSFFEGKDEGEITAKTEVVINLLKRGMDDREIMEITGLSSEQVRGIRAERQ